MQSSWLNRAVGVDSICKSNADSKRAAGLSARLKQQGDGV